MWRACGETISVTHACAGRFVVCCRHPGTISGRRRRRIRSRIARNSRLGTATSAIWKITYRECVTTFAPILINFFCNVRREVIESKQVTGVPSPRSLLLLRSPSGLPAQQQPGHYPCRRFHLILGRILSSAWGQAKGTRDTCALALVIHSFWQYLHRQATEGVLAVILP